MEFENIPWSVAKGKTEAYIYEIRFRQFGASFPRSRYPTRLNIFWEMVEPSAFGLSSPDELERLHTFENRLIEAVETDEHSILSMVLTGDNKREFVFHTMDQEEFIERLTNMPQEEEIYPIEIQSYEDEEWVYDEDVIGNMN